MKRKIIITQNGETIFKGRIINIKIKESAIISKSIELFDDEEPCIIHQSYVYKEYANVLVDLFQKSGSKTINGIDYEEELSFLDYSDLPSIQITLG
jgi:hypothetical protein